MFDGLQTYQTRPNKGTGEMTGALLPKEYLHLTLANKKK